MIRSLIVTRASVEPQFLGSMSREIEFLEFNGIAFVVVGDIPADNETPVVTLSISKICQLNRQ